ncbi:MAG: hypothetical protein B7Y02_11470 [Rhodobacterales bacterium 17-64-5]|nr:MAG: hypothetical protein B7Y02_11470 [Rhodobacterales bacterium 17-64-5]
MPDTIPPEGVIIRADNGDVIRYDATGLVLRLSDRVIADIAARLQLPASVEASAETLPDLPEDIDLWAPQRHGDWVHFQANLPGAESARGYIRHIDGGAILAEARGPLLGILGIGGARAALASPSPARFPWHVLGPADDIGAVGMGGEGEAPLTAALALLRELTVEALVADTLITRRAEARLSLPRMFVRVETDSAADAGALATGAAAGNLDLALQNLVAAARRLGTPARVLAVVLDYALEDVTGDPTAYRDGMIALMERITRSMARLGLARPVFLAAFDCGTHRVTKGPGLDGQWELSWNHGDHQLVFAAPSYAFEIDDTGRLTDQGRAAKAALLAEALLAVEAGSRWQCPTIQLAERSGKDIRLICEAAGPLVLDKDDPFQAGPLSGFAVEGVTNGAKLMKVEIDKTDPKAVILRCSKRPEGAVYVTYAHAAEPGQGPYPANRGSLRDDHGAGQVRRWALPVRLKLTDGR